MDGKSFLEGLRGDPDDDALRLVYSDWLEENGDVARAEFVRAQCALATRRTDDGSIGDLQRRIDALLETHGKAWFGNVHVSSEREADGLPPGINILRRGFLERVALTPSIFSHQRALLNREPVTEMTVFMPHARSVSRHIAHLSDGFWGGIRRLVIDTPRLSKSRERFWNLGKVKRLESLTLHAPFGDADMLRRIIQAKVNRLLPGLHLLVSNSIIHLNQEDRDTAHERNIALATPGMLELNMPLVLRLEAAGCPAHVIVREFAHASPEDTADFAEEYWIGCVEPENVHVRARQADLLRRLYARQRRTMPARIHEYVSQAKIHA